MSRKGTLVSFAAGLVLCGRIAEAQEESPASVRPTQHLLIRPSTMSWAELLVLQASLPATRAEPPAQAGTQELPPIEASVTSGTNDRGVDGLQQGNPCYSTGFSCEPPLFAGFDSQLDVPDSSGISFVPPDVAGGVGPNHLMTMLDNKVLIQNRVGATVSSVDTSTFWSPLGTTPLSPTTTYPRVYFDALNSRWIASIRSGLTANGSTSIYFASSQTDDPTGTWDFYSFPADPTATSFADWVVMGYNATWIAITANMFATPGGGSLGAKLWAIDASTLGGILTVSIFAPGFMMTAHGNNGTSPHPARTFDLNPALWMVNDAFVSGGVFLLQLTKITGTGAAPVVSGLAGSPFGGTTSLCFVGANWSSTQLPMTQVSETRLISPFSTRIASVAARCDSLWVANSGGLPGPSTNATPTSDGVIWHELNPVLAFPATPPTGGPAGMILQCGAVTNGASTMSLYPSIAVSRAGDVLLGFANGDATISPRACYAMRLRTDPLNTMRPIQELKAGESRYWKKFGPGVLAEYGRYSSTCVDPLDDSTLWTIQEFADTRVGSNDEDSRWGTHWGRLGNECCEDSSDLDDWTIDITVDNKYDLYVGDDLATSLVVGSDNNWPTTETWLVSGRKSSDYLYLATASDHSGAQGLIAAFTNDTLGITRLTGEPEWEVFPAGRYAETNSNYPGAWPTNVMPTQAELDTAISFATINNLWVTPSSAPGYTNGALPWNTRPVIPAQARWIWFESGSVPGILYPSPFQGGNHDEFLVFRVRGTNCPCPTEPDFFEENDTCSTAAKPAPFTSWVNLSVSRTDEDWYRLTVPGKKKLKVDVLFKHATGNIDARLYDTCNGTVLTSGTSSDDDELIQWKNPSPFLRFVYLQVYISDSSQQPCNTYQLSWSHSKIKKK
jgi:hypothetical protein